MGKLNVRYFFSKLRKGKIIWIIGLVLLILVTYWMISNLEQEMSKIEIIPDDNLLLPGLGADVENEIEDWGYSNNKAFFVEYRLQRERVRDREIEVLQEMIEQTATTEEGKQEAEKQILALVELMELELKVENLIKAQGYEDIVFFFDDDIATVMVKIDNLSEREYACIADTVAKVVGVQRETVQVISGN